MFVSFDLETTGFSGNSDDVIQFSYIKFDSNNVVYDAGTLFFYYEGMSWSEEAYAVHGISQEFLKQFENVFKENVIKMWTILSGANVVGHNSDSFDCPFAKTWLTRQGCGSLEFGIMNDTMKAFRPVTKTAKISLVKLSSMMGLTPEVIKNAARMWFKEDGLTMQAHNANYDTTATALLALIAINKGYMSFERVSVVSYDEVDADALLDSTPPNMVDFDIKEPDGTIRTYTLGGYKHGNSIKFPIELEYVRHGVYSDSASTYTLDTTSDTFTMSFCGMELIANQDFDVLDYTKKLAKGGN